MTPEDEKRLADALSRPGAKLILARDVAEEMKRQIQSPTISTIETWRGAPFEVRDELESGTFVVIEKTLDTDAFLDNLRSLVSETGGRNDP